MGYQLDMDKIETLLVDFVKDEEEGIKKYKKLLKFIEKYGNKEDVKEVKGIIEDEKDHLDFVSYLALKYF